MNTVLENIIEVFENRNTPDSKVEVSFIVEILKMNLDAERRMIIDCSTSACFRSHTLHPDRLHPIESGKQSYEQLKSE